MKKASLSLCEFINPEYLEEAILRDWARNPKNIEDLLKGTVTNLKELEKLFKAANWRDFVSKPLIDLNGKLNIFKRIASDSTDDLLSEDKSYFEKVVDWIERNIREFEQAQIRKTPFVPDLIFPAPLHSSSTLARQNDPASPNIGPRALGSYRNDNPSLKRNGGV